MGGEAACAYAEDGCSRRHCSLASRLTSLVAVPFLISHLLLPGASWRPFKGNGCAPAL